VVKDRKTRAHGCATLQLDPLLALKKSSNLSPERCSREIAVLPEK